MQNKCKNLKLKYADVKRLTAPSDLQIKIKNRYKAGATTIVMSRRKRLALRLTPQSSMIFRYESSVGLFSAFFWQQGFQLLRRVIEIKNIKDKK